MSTSVAKLFLATQDYDDVYGSMYGNNYANVRDWMCREISENVSGNTHGSISDTICSYSTYTSLQLLWTLPLVVLSTPPPLLLPPPLSVRMCCVPSYFYANFSTYLATRRKKYLKHPQILEIESPSPVLPCGAASSSPLFLLIDLPRSLMVTPPMTTSIPPLSTLPPLLPTCSVATPRARVTFAGWGLSRGRGPKSKEEQMADKGLWRKGAAGRKRKRCGAIDHIWHLAPPWSERGAIVTFGAAVQRMRCDRLRLALPRSESGAMVQSVTFGGTVK